MAVVVQRQQCTWKGSNCIWFLKLTLDKQAQHVSLETMKSPSQLAGILARLLIDQKLREQFVCHAVAYFCLIRQPLLNVFLLSTTNLQAHIHTSERVCVVCCVYVCTWALAHSVIKNVSTYYFQPERQPKPFCSSWHREVSPCPFHRVSSTPENGQRKMDHFYTFCARNLMVSLCSFEAKAKLSFVQDAFTM